VLGFFLVFTVASVMSMVAPSQYQNLGFDSVAAGDVKVDWLGSADNLTVAAKVGLTPSGVSMLFLCAAAWMQTYMMLMERWTFRAFDVQTFCESDSCSWGFGCVSYSAGSQINADLTTGNLNEFNQVLTALGFPQTQDRSAGIPAQLHGRRNSTDR